MRAFKIADCVIQVILILAAIITAFAGSLDDVIPLYFVVGGWQLLSVFIHLANRQEGESQSRKRYHWLLITTVIITAVALLALLVTADHMIIFMFLMLVWTAGLAFMYLSVCLQEMRQLHKADQQETGE